MTRNMYLCLVAAITTATWFAMIGLISIMLTLVKGVM